ncbi:hypothetical protein EYF80_015112 [Liparis tanakae]|uniref:Uncharacterized protein n=1 Tax=Liparis tanakae TaxID=230148 RepID=A0A4Z2IAX9_9TELE|nr:hypothetical protein EYF80_015112 [Liparis tanakae]
MTQNDSKTSVLTDDGVPQVLCDDAHVVDVHKVQVVLHRRSHHLPQQLVVAVPGGDHQHRHALLPQLGHRLDHVAGLHPVRQPHQHPREPFPRPARRSGSQRPLPRHSQRFHRVGVPSQRLDVPQGLLEAALGAVGVEAELQTRLGAHLQEPHPHLVLPQREGQKELRQEGEHARVLVGRHAPRGVQQEEDVSLAAVQHCGGGKTMKITAEMRMT